MGCGPPFSPSKNRILPPPHLSTKRIPTPQIKSNHTLQITKMEDDQNRRQPKWKTNKMKDDQNGRQPRLKTTKMEDDQNGRRPKWKTTKMEDDQIGRRPK